MAQNSVPRKRRINLALQGGGAHGAFTWGVLDRLLEDERIAIEGISGTSAGAMNAAVLAHGFVHGGNAAARVPPSVRSAAIRSTSGSAIGISTRRRARCGGT